IGDGSPGLRGDPWDRSVSIVGNSFVSVRVAGSGYGGTNLVFCGNFVSNSPPTDMHKVLWCEVNGAALAMIAPSSRVNMSGNTLTNAGYAISSYANQPGYNYFILANDF